ncbi:hypothetical protein [Paraburkholderia silvatlantica]|uniref:Uncharacterized protein n=1 Tax=Paraburkholderia silvatlantica TaxID=321895 RepID=A0ABR6FW56_9BURK|nr:hypothetical protein [Paraburkholderia silvatlantica]MBB2930990.1 hypothetical protein [Paraburkholderia silvatlantica]PVY26973.1 hypothetical protein C7411_12121 [Paraburkholderia silvatlantica]PXW33249.1 hypothetical protein C7413_12021 [Paraburkholderia silvatlantica]
MHPHAEEDLAHIEARSPDDADDIWAFLEIVDGSDELKDRLCAWHYRQTHEDPQFDCKAVVSLQGEGYNIYRMYSLEMEWGRKHYRILYAYEAATEPDEDMFHILAVVMKRIDDTPQELRVEAYDYEPDHPITDRVRRDYEALGLPIRH